MKRVSFALCVIAFFGFAANSFATSPQPEGVKPGHTTPACSIHMVYIADPEKGIPGGDSSSNLVFEAIQPKKDVLERVTEYVGNRMNEGNVAEFKIECKFLK